jgi:hypothetical protein
VNATLPRHDSQDSITGHRCARREAVSAKTRLALALALALPAVSIAASSTDKHADNAHGIDLAHVSPHYALRMSQRAERNATRQLRTSMRRGMTPSGNTLPVTSCADDGGAGTLRSVVYSAAEGDTVDLSQLSCGTITLVEGAIDIGVLGEHHINDLSIIGPGSDALTIDGNSDRVFVHGDFQVGLGTLSISDLTIANGDYTHGLASCIDSSGNVELTRAVVTGCKASNGGPLTFGGAVSAAYLTMTSSAISDSRSEASGDNVAIGGGAYVMDDAVLIGSTISGNVAIAQSPGDGELYLTAGAGLYVRGGLTMEASTVSDNSLVTYDLFHGPGGGIFVRDDTDIADSTFSRNIAATGGGLYKAVFSHYGDPGTTLRIANSTFSANGAYYFGGAIVTFRPTTIANSTISQNNAGLGVAGVWGRGDHVALELQSTIIAKNSYGDVSGMYFDLFSDRPITVSGANNLVMVASHATLPDDTLDVDPLLAALADNGGPTETMALDPRSPAIDVGNNVTDLAFDQRGEGFARIAGAGPDIGAFELQVGPSDTIFEDGFD